MMTQGYSALSKLIITCVFALNGYAIVFAIEDWPFTNAPMFAHYVDESTPRYRFAFDAVLEDGSTQRIHYAHAGLRWMTMRYFFKYVYGGVDEHSPFTVFPDDTTEAFEYRLTQFFSVLLKRPAIKKLPIDTVTLSLIPLAWEDNHEGTAIHLGSYDTKTQSFRHEYQHEN